MAAGRRPDPAGSTAPPNSYHGLAGDLSLGQKMMSALSGSILTSLLVTPLDVVRIRLQSQQSQSHSSNIRYARSISSLPAFHELPADLGIGSCCRQVLSFNAGPAHCLASSNMMFVQTPLPMQALRAMSPTVECAVETARRNRYSSTIDALFKIARHEGPSTLWRGLTATLVMAVPANVIYFSGYDWLRLNPASPFKRLDILPDNYAPLLAGSSARIVAAITISPIEMFRTRLQATPSNAARPHPVADTLSGMRQMVRSNGIFSLWRGLTLTLWRDAPFSAIYWFNYEAIRRSLALRRLEATGDNDADRLGPARPQNATATLVDSFIAGAASGAIASAVTQPFDVGKTRKQITNVLPASTGSAASTVARQLPEELPMPRFIWHIFRQHGLNGLFQGGVPRLLKVAPSCAIMISTYEISKKLAFSMTKHE